MKARNPDPETTELCSTVTVRDYREMVRRHDRLSIADMIRLRFAERYLTPMLEAPQAHGFAILALSCLMVEALESFRQGWTTTDRRSEAAFCSFFQRHDQFAELRPVAHEFYRAVRCGILHQAETTQQWRVHRGKPLLQEAAGTRWVSAAEFGRRLKRALEDYCKELKNADWNSTLWVRTRTKLRSVCKNCGALDTSALM